VSSTLFSDFAVGVLPKRPVQVLALEPLRAIDGINVCIQWNDLSIF
jgi:hypothetical protein